MSAKREKQVRRIARNQFRFARNMWLRSEPPRWRIFKYMKWKKAKPDYQLFEKKIRDIAKRKTLYIPLPLTKSRIQPISIRNIAKGGGK